MKLYKVLVEEKLARSRTEAERFIRQGAVSVGGCEPDCSFFSTGKCNCNGWEKITNPTQDIAAGLAVKVSSGMWRVMNKLDGSSGFDQINGIGRVRPDHPKDPNQLAKLTVDISTGEVDDITRKS